MKKYKWKCKTCKHHIGVVIGDKVYIYCLKEHNYPSRNFIICWGCDRYEKESEQLSLFEDEERRSK